MRPLIIPFFISHQGCPHQCVFCNQKHISGEGGVTPLSAQDISNGIDKALYTMNKNGRPVQVAFYGGSFTGLPFDRQKELLEAVKGYLKTGAVSTIRISTRPDYINKNIVELLKAEGVGIVELGIQSMEQRVLDICERGHTVQESVDALCLLKKEGVAAGAQLMVGLPGETSSGMFAGAKKLISLQPDLVRIYPVVVVRASGLERMYQEGSFRPITLNKAIALVARLKALFDQTGIPVIRMGLQHTESLHENLIAGPYHPAFGELVLSRMFFNKTRKKLAEMKSPNHVEKIFIAASDESIFRGQSNINIKRLEALRLLSDTEIVFDPDQERGTVVIK